MKFSTFKKMLLTKFKFVDSVYVGEPGQKYLGFPESDGRKIELSGFCQMPVEDTETHFMAMALLDGSSDEVVHITEPGKYFDCVFWNDHERGLFSIDCIDDDFEDLDIDGYAAMSKDERIEQMPFFENLIAKSLQQFFDGIQSYTQEEFWGPE